MIYAVVTTSSNWVVGSICTIGILQFLIDCFLQHMHVCAGLVEIDHHFI